MMAPFPSGTSPSRASTRRRTPGSRSSAPRCAKSASFGLGARPSTAAGATSPTGPRPPPREHPNRPPQTHEKIPKHLQRPWRSSQRRVRRTAQWATRRCGSEARTVLQVRQDSGEPSASHFPRPLRDKPAQPETGARRPDFRKACEAIGFTGVKRIDAIFDWLKEPSDDCVSGGPGLRSEAAQSTPLGGGCLGDSESLGGSKTC